MKKFQTQIQTPFLYIEWQFLFSKYTPFFCLSDDINFIKIEWTFMRLITSGTYKFWIRNRFNSSPKKYIYICFIIKEANFKFFVNRRKRPPSLCRWLILMKLDNSASLVWGKMRFFSFFFCFRRRRL